MRLLVTGAWREAEAYRAELESAGHTVVFMQQEKDALPCDPSWPEGVVCNGLFLYHDIRAFTGLKLIQLTSAGFDRVPLDYIRQNNIALHNARGVYSIPMAEHAVSAVLTIFRNSRVFFRQQAAHVWEKQRDLRELFGSTVCIIGCGSVGCACAERFAAFGCKVVGVDAAPFNAPAFDSIYGVDALHAVIPKADVVVLTLPLNRHTEGLADKRFFQCLKPGCVLVNISRGKIIDTDALTDALSRQSLYAALDVFDDEPLAADSPLWDMHNVIITPHNSFVGAGNGERLHQVILKGLNHG